MYYMLELLKFYVIFFSGITDNSIKLQTIYSVVHPTFNYMLYYNIHITIPNKLQCHVYFFQ